MRRPGQRRGLATVQVNSAPSNVALLLPSNRDATVPCRDRDPRSIVALPHARSRTWALARTQGGGVKYKNIKSVAHNLGHSFLSDTNARGEGSRYVIVPEELFRAAARERVPQVRIDFIARTLEPAHLADSELQRAVEHYADWLPELLASQNISPEAVRGARLTLTFDYSRQRSTPYHPERSTQEFVCEVELADDRGIVHRANPDHWWMA
jgi:hypothetical protein